MKLHKILIDIPFGLFNTAYGVYFKKGDRVYFVANDLKEILRFDFPFVLEGVNNDFIIIRSKESIQLFSFEYRLIKTILFKNYGNKQVKYIDEKRIFLREKIDDNWQVSVIDINSNYIWTKSSNDDLIIVGLIGNFFLSKQEKLLTIMNENSGHIVWQKEFNDLIKGDKINQYGNIIAYKDKVYVYVADDKDSKNTATVCLDQNTGEILDVYKGFAGNLILHDDKLFVASYSLVKILDLKTNKITEIDFAEVLNPLNLQIFWNKSVVHKNLLYFIDGHWSTTNQLGILDLENQKLLWHDAMKIHDTINNNIQEIRAINNRLYVHCSDNSLHIFEK
jgi:hypothetical protein